MSTGKPKIIILGAMHDDPSGKARLYLNLKEVVADLDAPLDFIAFEWAQATYTQLASKRVEAQERLRSEVPRLNQNFSDRFASTLGYEPDLHHEVIPDSQLIWMLNGHVRGDIGIVGDQRLVDQAISVKLTNLKDWLLPKIPNWVNLSEEALLSITTRIYKEESIRLATVSEPDNGLARSIKANRDSYMFDKLQPALSQLKDRSQMGVIIVGTAHLANTCGSLYSLCLSNDFTVERRWPHEQ